MRRLRSTDGVEVSLHDLGGRRGSPDLLIVHATGFCAQVYARLAVSLGSAYRCWGVDLRGHGLSRVPDGVSYAWDGLAADVLAAARGVAGASGGGAGGTPLIALGHSSGGAAVLLAEA